jgi:O-antigen ligase
VLFSVALVKRYLSPNVSRMSEKLSFVSDVLKAPSDTIKNDASSFTRLTAWGLSVGLIKSRPVWGVGAGQFPVLYSQAFPELYKDLPSTMYDPYPVQTSSNSYLYYAVEFGLLPALFMFVFVARAFYLAAKSGHNSPYFPFFIAGICMTLWLMTCDYIGERIFWIGLGAMSAPTFVVSRGIRGNDGR